MARSAIRTSSLILDDIGRMETLFGTVANSYRILGFQASELTYAQFYRGMNRQNVTPQQKELIEDAWIRWQHIFLRPEVPPSSDFTLAPIMRDFEPDWHPDNFLEDDTEET